MKNIKTIIFVLVFTVLFSFAGVLATEDLNQNQIMSDYDFDYEITVFPESRCVVIEWDGFDYGRIGAVKLGIFDSVQTEPLMTTTCSVYDKKAMLFYLPEHKSIHTQMVLEYDGSDTEPLKKFVRLDDMPIKLPEENSVSQNQLAIAYTNAVNTTVDFTVNAQTASVLLDGTGSFDVVLKDEWNDVEVFYTDNYGIKWCIQKRIFVDKTPPVIKMSKNFDGITTDFDSITISGSAFDCSKVMVNSEIVPVFENGMFSTEVSLEKGENRIVVTAQDAAGNQTRYTAKVTCGKKKLSENTYNTATPEAKVTFDKALTSESNNWILIITGGLCLLVIIYALIFWRKGKEGEK